MSEIENANSTDLLTSNVKYLFKSLCKHFGFEPIPTNEPTESPDNNAESHEDSDGDSDDSSIYDMDDDFDVALEDRVVKLRIPENS